MESMMSSSNGKHDNGEAITAEPAPRISVRPRSRSSAEDAPAPESVKVAIAPRYGHFINGKWSEPKATKKSDAYFETINPANEKVLSKVAQGSDADVESAVSAAEKSLPAWSKLPATERAKYLFRI